MLLGPFSAGNPGSKNAAVILPTTILNNGRKSGGPQRKRFPGNAGMPAESRMIVGLKLPVRSSGPRAAAALPNRNRVKLR
jgi:hypothetical protein